MITREEILAAIQEQDFEILKEGVQYIAKEAGYDGPLDTVGQIARFCEEDEEALEFVMA